MPTLRDHLRSRRDWYLERVAVFNTLHCDEPFDIRVAPARGFLEGGDDIPPELEAKGVQRERRRVPDWISDQKRDDAEARLNEPKAAQVSDASDWDQFFVAATKGGSGNNLYRITAQLVRATEYFQRGVELKEGQIFEVFDGALPSIADTSDVVAKAWRLLWLCGAPEPVLEKSYRHLIDAVGPFETQGVDVIDALLKVIGTWRSRFSGRFEARDTQRCVGGQTRPRGFSEACPCQGRPPTRDGSAAGGGTAPPSLVEAVEASRDAVLAGLDVHDPVQIIEEFRFLGASDVLIAQILLWLSERWSRVPAVYRYRHAGWEWRASHPEAEVFFPDDPDTDPALLGTGERWRKDLGTFARLRAIPRYFMALSEFTTVGQACVQMVKDLWPDEDHSPYTEKQIEDSAITREDYLAAVQRAGARSDCAFRLAALVSAPEGYLRVLDKVSTGGEDGTGADRLARPTLTPLSALYWRTTIIPSTIGHILTMADTADFHIAEHLRFLGLFRPGGRYRTGKPENATYERFISQLVPDWVIDFMTAAVLRVKYWLGDRPLGRPNDEEMTYWSENHQVLFASAEYILPSFFPQHRFAWQDQSASWHRDRALPRVRAWLDHRLELGFSELNSGVYYHQHLPALFNLVDFAPDEEIVMKARIALDLMIFDVVRRVCQGSFVAASGRHYWGSKRSGWSSSMLDTVELLTGLVGDHWNADSGGAISLATSRYLDEIPECLLALAHDTGAPRVDRSRVSINLDESEDYGIDPDSSSGIVFWWGNGAYFTEETFGTSQSWSYRWGLRNTGAFKLFEYIDNAIYRLVSAIVSFYSSLVGVAISAARTAVVGWLLGHLTTILGGSFIGSAVSGKTPSVGFPVDMMNSALAVPQYMRRFVDIALSALDVVIGAIVGVLKAAGVLDKNDDCVRVARPALEQEFRELAIEFNKGSVLGRQHFYGWRSRDAMMSSLTDAAKGATSFQGEPCIATLGLNVSVFTGKRIRTGDGFFSNLGRGLEGYVVNAARYAYDPEVFLTSQFGVFGGETAPELGALAAPFAAGKVFGDDGPGYWYGNLSAPLVHQHENVAISIYSPSDLQENLAPKETHAHWPFDHFDEVITDERSGGRWVFGRRDRRSSPRTPCAPFSKRPTPERPWADGNRREERGEGSGYVALFSANGMKTSPGHPFGHRELIAEGHKNIWITIVGDRATYGSFCAFRDDVLAANLDVDVDDLHCSLTVPLPGSAKSNQKGKPFEVSWDDGATIDGKKVETDGWPRFEWKATAMKANPASSLYGLRVDDVRITSKADPAKGRVDWGEKAWLIEVTVRSWEEKEEAGRKRWVESSAVLSVEHDFSAKPEQRPVAEMRKTSPDGTQAFHPLRPSTKTLTARVAGATAAPQKNTKSALGESFRRDREAFRLER